ncbi:MAG: RNA polymerase sigma factor [Planctomycetes bacterium]|nr:RNA polymerase sigma factor [Planctomycetota bacterium]MBM4056658.1 RNA polymerase sigma factor [Planctomycetota bacterium]
MESPDDRQRWVLALLAAHEQALLRHACRLLGDADAARDAVQHAFVQLCAQSPATLGDRAVPWLFRVCRNRAIDHLRRAGRERSFADLPTESTAMPPSAQPTARETDPAASAETADLAGVLRGLLATLPHLQAETLDLWAAGLSYREIAAVTGKTEGHVRVLAHRGLAALRANPLVRDLLPTPVAPEVHR